MKIMRNPRHYTAVCSLGRPFFTDHNHEMVCDVSPEALNSAAGEYQVLHLKLRARDMDLPSVSCLAVCAVAVAQQSRRISSGLGGLLVLPRNSTATNTDNEVRYLTSIGSFQSFQTISSSRVTHSAYRRCVQDIRSTTSTAVMTFDS